MAQLLSAHGKIGKLKENENFFKLTSERFPGVFKEGVDYHQELREAFRGAHVVKDLGFGRLFLFEGLDSLGRVWQFIYKVDQGNMVLDGELISANPASFLPARGPDVPIDVTPHPDQRAYSKGDLDKISSEIMDLSKRDAVVFTNHIYEYMSERLLSEVDLLHILKTGTVTSSLGVDEWGTPRFRWRGDDTGGNPYRLILGLKDKVIIISAAPYERDIPYKKYKK